MAKLTACTADVVVMDIGLRGMDGVEVIRCSRAGQPDLPIVVNTAYGRYRDETNAVSPDGIVYVVKSSDLGELKGSIKQALRLPTQDGGATKGDR